MLTTNLPNQDKLYESLAQLNFKWRKCATSTLLVAISDHEIFHNVRDFVVDRDFKLTSVAPSDGVPLPNITVLVFDEIHFVRDSCGATAIIISFNR